MAFTACNATVPDADGGFSAFGFSGWGSFVGSGFTSTEDKKHYTNTSPAKQFSNDCRNQSDQEYQSLRGRGWTCLWGGSIFLDESILMFWKTVNQVFFLT